MDGIYPRNLANAISPLSTAVVRHGESDEKGSQMLKRSGRWIAAVIAAVALAAGGAGVAFAGHHHHHHGIPQHNGGDHDADNNGGPSDGDGNV